jgi:hypothetical protein
VQAYASLIYWGGHHEGRARLPTNVLPRGRPIMPPSSLGGRRAHTRAPHGLGARPAARRRAVGPRGTHTRPTRQARRACVRPTLGTHISREALTSPRGDVPSCPRQVLGRRGGARVGRACVRSGAHPAARHGPSRNAYAPLTAGGARTCVPHPGRTRWGRALVCPQRVRLGWAPSPSPFAFSFSL